MSQVPIIDVLTTVFIGLVTATIVALVRRYRASVLSAIGNGLARLPKVMTRSAPSALTLPGEQRDLVTVEKRLEYLRGLKRPRYLILGGIYLDIQVTPVSATTFDGSEHDDLDRVELSCGGSARYVGMYLNQIYGVRSELYTRLGKDDRLSRELRKLLKKERWIRRRRFQDDDTLQSGVSIQLFHRQDPHHTTLTYKGALSALAWNHRSLRQLKNSAAGGGIMHISGYFRTGLHAGLSRSLRELSAGLLVCVDHGSFVPRDHDNASAALLQAFADKLVDVYICTQAELHTLMLMAKLNHDPTLPLERQLEAYASGSVLPRITIVQPEPAGGLARAHIILDDEVTAVDVAIAPGAWQYIPGRSNAFNASLMHALVHNQERAFLRETLTIAVAEALGAWANLG